MTSSVNCLDIPEMNYYEKIIILYVILICQKKYSETFGILYNIKKFGNELLGIKKRMVQHIGYRQQLPQFYEKMIILLNIFPLERILQN